MKKLTKRQREILDFIKSYIKKHNYPPTIREVADGFEISVKGSYDHIKAIEKKEYIRCNLNRSRAIEILDNDEQSDTVTKKVPILGSVAAGQPLFAEENFDGTIAIPSDFVGKGKCFAVKVKGDSMKDAGILDGDIAIIDHRDMAENGEIVVAMVDEAVTLKRLYLEKNRIKLQSENTDFPPIYTRNAKILGKLACVVRKYK
jgi:repressor LexA